MFCCNCIESFQCFYVSLYSCVLLVVGSLVTRSNRAVSQDFVELSGAETALLSPDHSHWYADPEGRALPPIHLETCIQTQEFLQTHFVALDSEESRKQVNSSVSPRIIIFSLDFTTRVVWVFIICIYIFMMQRYKTSVNWSECKFLYVF